MDHWRTRLADALHEVELRGHRGRPGGGRATARGRCGLEWDPACLEFHRTRRPIRTASQTQVRQPIYRRSVGRWKCYQRELADLFARIDSGGDA